MITAPFWKCVQNTIFNASFGKRHPLFSASSFFLLCAVRAYTNAHYIQVNMVIWLFSQGWRYVIIRNRFMMRHLNRFLAQGEEDFNKNVSKIQMAGGLPREGEMLKLGCDWLHYQLAWYSTRFLFHFPTITSSLEIKPFLFVSQLICTWRFLSPISFFVYSQKVNDARKLKELFLKARIARCRSRFVVPVILFEGKVFHLVFVLPLASQLCLLVIPDMFIKHNNDFNVSDLPHSYAMLLELLQKKGLKKKCINYITCIHHLSAYRRPV